MSLKQRYARNALDERLDRFSALLSEDIDRNTMNAAIETIKKLNSIDLTKIPTFDKARDEAVTMTSDALAGVDKRSLGTKAMDLFRQRKSPFLDALSFASAMRSFFPLLQQYVTALGTKAGGPELDRSQSLNTLMGDAEGYGSNAAANLRKVVEKGFKPDGLFAKLGNDWRKKFNISYDDIVNQIMEMSLDDVDNVTKAVKTATSGTSKIADKVAAQVSSEPKAPGGPTAAQGAATPKAAAKPVGNDALDDIVGAVKKKLGGDASPDTIRKIVKIVDDLYGVNR